MAFSDIATIREHTGLKDAQKVPDLLISQRLEDAHNDIVRDLRSEFSSSTDPVLKTAETELSAAYLLRSLATSKTFTEQNLTAGQIRFSNEGKGKNLLELAEDEEKRAWAKLGPYLVGGVESFDFSGVEPETGIGSGE